jgi:NADPH:quinone reductase-like Zn-dependent oxidoreductase
MRDTVRPTFFGLKELPQPAPKDNEVLIKTRATTVSSGDWRVRNLEVPAGFGLLSRLALGVFGPRQKILGSQLAGQIESVGSKVTKFKAGDYTREDFTKNGETWDVIMDTAGTAPFSRCEKSLNEGGRLLMVLGRLSDMFRIPCLSLTGCRKIVAESSGPR